MIVHGAGDSKPYTHQEYPRHVYVKDADGKYVTVEVKTELELEVVGPHLKHPAEVEAAKAAEAEKKPKGKKGKTEDPAE